MQGASALNAVLTGLHSDARVFAVWEPVLGSDTAPPYSRTLALISQPQAVQFWDPDKHVSARLGAYFRDQRSIVVTGSESLVRGVVVWDVVAVYPPGARWDDQPPQPAFVGAPIVRTTAELRQALQHVIVPTEPVAAAAR